MCGRYNCRIDAPGKRFLRMIWLKQKIVNWVEIILDAVLDRLVPYKALSKTRLKTLVFPKWLYFDYVLNQKIQRLQLLDLLRERGITDPPVVKLWWSRGLNNFGDELTGYLLACIAGLDCVFDRNKNFISIGSTIRFSREDSIVWGSGILRSNEVINAKPQCLAVRGPITRQKLLDQSVSCPEIYGDPAMLFPLIYTPKVDQASQKPLIIPHFKHSDLIKRHPDCDYLDLHVYSIKNIENVIDRLATASRVLTSSLHGFIFCVAYGVPVTVFSLERQGIGGDNVKFDDFCAGVGLKPITIHSLDDADKMAVKALLDKAENHAPNWAPGPLLESLYKIYPTPSLAKFLKET